MGILADFHVLDDEGIARLQRGESMRAPMELKGLTVIEMAALDEALTGAEFGGAIDASEVRACEGSDAAITILSRDLVDALAALPDAKVARVAKKWAAIEDMHASASELEPILQDLVDLAKTAVPPKRLVLWNCP